MMNRERYRRVRAALAVAAFGSTLLLAAAAAAPAQTGTAQAPETGPGDPADLGGPRYLRFEPLRPEALERSDYRYAVAGRRVWIEPSVIAGSDGMAYELILDFAAETPQIITVAEAVRQYRVMPMLDLEVYAFAIQHLLLILPPTHPAHPCRRLNWSCEVPQEPDAVGEDTLRYHAEGEVDAAGFTFPFRVAITLRMPQAIPIRLEDLESGWGFAKSELSGEPPEEARFKPPAGFRRYEPGR